MAGSSSMVIGTSYAFKFICLVEETGLESALSICLQKIYCIFNFLNGILIPSFISALSKVNKFRQAKNCYWEE